MLTEGNRKVRTVLRSCEKDQTALVILRVLFSEMCSVEAKTPGVFMTSLSTSELHAIIVIVGWNWNGL
jgi:hypothetical protein